MVDKSENYRVLSLLYAAYKIQWNLYSSFSSGVWKRNNGSGRTIDAGAIVEIGFAQGPQKLNDASGKTNYPGTIDRGFTVLLYSESGQGKLMPKKCCTNLLSVSVQSVSIKCVDVPLAHGLMQILSVERLGIISCFRIFLLTELNTPPLTGNMK
jgi:hypothetical protein